MIPIRFCSECDNMLIPRKNKLLCLICDRTYEFDSIQQKYYKLKKIIKHDEKDFDTIVINEISAKDRISHNDREAYEEYFKING